MLVNKCVICLSVFGDWSEYNMHHKNVHNMFSKTVRSEKTSNRTKGQIITDFETRHPELFVMVPQKYAISTCS